MANQPRSSCAVTAERSYLWTGESTIAVRAFVDFLIQRSAALDLRVPGLEASTLIELTAFGTAVMMNYRLTDALHTNPPGDDA